MAPGLARGRPGRTGPPSGAEDCLAELDGFVETLPERSVLAGYALALGGQLAFALGDDAWLARRRSRLEAFEGRMFHLGGHAPTRASDPRTRRAGTGSHKTATVPHSEVLRRVVGLQPVRVPS